MIIVFSSFAARGLANAKCSTGYEPGWGGGGDGVVSLDCRVNRRTRGEQEESLDIPEATALTVEKIRPATTRSEPLCHSLSHDWELFVAADGCVFCQYCVTAKARGPVDPAPERHLSPQAFLPPSWDDLFRLCCSRLFSLNIASILVSFCLWFDFVSSGVTLGGRCAFCVESILVSCNLLLVSFVLV